MRSWLSKAMLVLMGLVILIPAVGQGTAVAESGAPVQRTMEVTGRAVISAKYDKATINVGVTALENSPTAAYDVMGAAMADVVAAMRRAGIKDDDMKTGVLSLGAEYDYTKEEGQRLKGYRATTTLSVTTRQLERVPALVQAAVDAGANQLQGVTFSLEDEEGLMEQALDMAVDDARAKADRVARRLGTSVVGVYRVSVMDYGGTMVKTTSGAGATRDASASAPVLGGMHEYSVSVAVTFELK